MSILLNCIDLRPTDRVLAIRETGTTDANFILTHLMKHVLGEGHQVALCAFHHALGHYQSVARRLGCDLPRRQAEGAVESVEALRAVAEGIGRGGGPPAAGALFAGQIEAAVRRLRARDAAARVYVLIDDVSHLLDLGVAVAPCLAFVGDCLRLLADERVVLVVGTHVSGGDDAILANSLNYAADVNVEVGGLRTGLSREVSGVMSIERSSEVKRFHFKAFEKGVKTFHLGESVYNLYK